MVRRWPFALLVWLCMGATPARPPPPVTLRMAAIAADGSTWAGVLKEFSNEVERGAGGDVHIKWYFGGIAGDEVTTLDQVARGDLDGIAGAIFCQRVAPTLRVLEVAGLVESDEEAAQVLRRLRPMVDEEFKNTPFAVLTVSSGFGHRVLFSRTPVRTLDELRRGRYWVYHLDEVERAQLPLMGVNVVPLPIDEAARAYDEHRVDGFIAIPGAALIYGYSAKAKYFTDLKSGFLPGCLVVSQRSLARLSAEQQQVMRQAGAHLGERFARVGRQLDDQLLGTVFAEHGLKEVPMSPAFRQQFLDAARAASEKLGPRLVPGALVHRVTAILDEQRVGP